MSKLKEQEQALVWRAQQGDRAAVGELYRLFAERLYRQVIYPYVPKAAAAEDLLKETFVTMMEQIQGYRWDPSRGIFPWLATIARNRCLDQHRKRSRHDRLNVFYQQHLAQTLYQSTPEQDLQESQEAEQIKERVRACLGEITPRYRKALELRMFQELSREECAARLEVQVGTFDVVYFRALKAFRKAWERALQAGQS